MKKYRIITLTGCKDEMIALSSLIRALDLSFEHTFIHTGKSWDYDPKKYFLADLNLRTPDLFLECETKDSFPQVITKLYELFKKHSPELLILTGSSNSSYGAIVAKELDIPVLYIPGNMLNNGNSYGKEVSIVKYNELLGRSPLFQVITEKYDKIIESYILTDLNLEENNYFFFSAKETDFDNPEFLNIMKTMNELAQLYKLPVICAITSLQKSRLEMSNLKFHPQIKFITGLLYSDYCKLLMCSKATITDSPNTIEESGVLNTPLIYIGKLKKEFIRYAAMTSSVSSEPSLVKYDIEHIISEKRKASERIKPAKYLNITTDIIKHIRALLINNRYGEIK